MTLTKIDRVVMVFLGLGLGWLGFGGAIIIHKIWFEGPHLPIFLFILIELCLLGIGVNGIYTIIQSIKGELK